MKLPKKEGAFQLQEEVKMLFYEQVSPMLEKLFSEFAPSDKVLSIENLTLDLGKIPLEKLEENLLKRIEKEFREKVKSEVGGHLYVEKKSGEKKKENAFLEKEKALTSWEIFLYFLATGNMPWNSTLESVSVLEKEVQVLLKKKGLFFQQLKVELTRHLSKKNIRTRLVSQFSNRFLATVIDGLLGKEMKEVALLFLVVEKQGESFGLGKREQQELRQVFWQVALKKAVNQPSGSSIEFIRVTLKEAVAYFSQVTQKEERAVCEEMEHRLVVLQKGKSIPNLPISSLKKVLAELKKELGRKEEQTSAEGKTEERDSKQNFTDKDSSQKGKEDQVDPFSKKSNQKNADNPVQNKEDSEGSNLPFSSKNKTEKGDEKSSREFADEIDENALSAKAKKELKQKEEAHLRDNVLHNEQEGIYIKNAGLVLLAPFVPTLFDTLGFISEKAISQQDKAVHLLQYLVDGATQTDESELALNKLLCGISLSDPIEQEAFFHPDELAEADGMLRAVIEHWKALKGTTPAGLQETFLQRDGKLYRTADQKWLLQVEQKTYDILLNQLPWGYSMIKLSWMEEMLTVEWA